MSNLLNSPTAHGAYLQDLFRQKEEYGKYTRHDVRKMATDAVGYNVTYEQMRHVWRQCRDRDPAVAGFFVSETQRKGEQQLEALNRAEIEAQARGIENWSIAWLKDQQTSFMVKNTVTERTVADMIDEAVDRLQKYSPTFKKLKRTKITEPHLLVIDPADIHIGKLVDPDETNYEYNRKIAVERCFEGVEGLLARSQGYPIDKIMFIIGNDVMHVDGRHNKTTSGTPQDVDGTWEQMYRDTIAMYVGVIERLLHVADVDVVYNKSNHDRGAGYFAARELMMYFRKHPNVTFTVNKHPRQYYTYGNNLICTTHGDGIKQEDLVYLMSNEHPDWNNSLRQKRYVYMHHLHHKKKLKWQDTIDTKGVTLQILRSPSPPDVWHVDHGYSMAPQAVEGFIHHKEQGQVCSITYYFS